MYKTHDSSGLSKQKAYIAKFNECIEYINHNYKENLSLEMMAQVSGYSKYHFTRWFKQFYNLSFNDYLTQVRVRVAETMLLNTQLSIMEIALEAGFQSIATFNRIFKETKRYTPNEYRHFHHLKSAIFESNINKQNTPNEKSIILSIVPPIMPMSADMNLPIYTYFSVKDIIQVGSDFYAISGEIGFAPGCPIMKSTNQLHWEIVSYVYDWFDKEDGFKDTALNVKYLRYECGLFYVFATHEEMGKTYFFTTNDIENGVWEKNSVDTVFFEKSLVFAEPRRIAAMVSNYSIYSAKLLGSSKLMNGTGVRCLVQSDEFYPLTKSKKYAAINEPRDIMDRKSLNNNTSQHMFEDERKLIINSDFHDGLENWSISEVAKLSISDRIKEDSTSVMAVSNRGTTGSGLAQYITGKITHGKVYKIIAEIMYNTGTDTRQFNVCICFGENRRPQIIASVNLIKGVWGKIDELYICPVDADLIETMVFIETSWEKYPKKEIDLMDYYVSNFSIIEQQDLNFEVDEEENKVDLSFPWQWINGSDRRFWSLTERPSFLRMKVGQICSDLMHAKNILTQRVLETEYSVTILLDVSGMKGGDECGCALFKSRYAYIGVKALAYSKYIVMVTEDETRNEIESIRLAQNLVYLKVNCDLNKEGGNVCFFYSIDGLHWSSIGAKVQVSSVSESDLGCRFGLFYYATQMIGGYVDFDYFRIENKLIKNNAELNILNVTMQETQEISGVYGEEIEVTLSMSALPEGDYSGIIASISIPVYFDIIDVIFCRDNIIGDCSYTVSEQQLKLKISGESVFFRNVNNDLFVLIRLKANCFVTEDTTSVIKPDYIYVTGVNVVYQTHNVQEEIILKYVESNALAKKLGCSNPLISHKYGADPYVIVHRDRVYVYLTGDIYEYDGYGKLKDNTYRKINSIVVISSTDMVNWTDHGKIEVSGENGVAKWAHNSWAPAAAYKTIDGKDKFFLYFANSGSDIGVLTSDTPIGPWEDPIGGPLIHRKIEGTENVTWCFDPAVLVDDDNKAYLYFGGGLPSDSQEDALHPKTARVIQLGEDMVSTVGKAEVIDAPALFEDSGIHKYNGKYYYSYCSNFSGKHPQDYPGYGEIAYMVSEHPMGPFEYQKVILKNPSEYFGVGGNNHHCIFEFRGQWFIAYHTQTLGLAKKRAKGYRSPHINRIHYNSDGTINMVQANMKGVSLLSTINPYERVEAETFAWSSGINTKKCLEKGKIYPEQNEMVTDIDTKDWFSVANVDFGENGAGLFHAYGASTVGATIELRIDSLQGPAIGTLGFESIDDENQWQLCSCPVERVVGQHTLFFLFKGDGEKDLLKLDYWFFS